MTSYIMCDILKSSVFGKFIEGGLLTLFPVREGSGGLDSGNDQLRCNGYLVVSKLSWEGLTWRFCC